MEGLSSGARCHAVCRQCHSSGSCQQLVNTVGLTTDNSDVIIVILHKLSGCFTHLVFFEAQLLGGSMLSSFRPSVVRRAPMLHP